MEQQVWAEEQAEAAGKLPPETEAALQDAHDKASALAKAQIQFNRDQTDAAYESAAQEAEGRAVQFFVKRGGEMGKVQNARLKPGEKCFMRDGDEWVFAGFIDSNGEPPPQPIIT